MNQSTKRNRSKPHRFEEQLAKYKVRLEAQLKKLSEGPEKEDLRKKIEQLGVAARMNAWLSPR